MAGQRVERRLAAILAADVSRYSSLMGADEEGTLRALKAHTAEVFEPTVGEHRGRIVKTTGDGFLVEFPSVVDAVDCACAIQRGMTERTAGDAADTRIEFRIGINVGDVIIEGGDIYGDGVNVAARLEALAEPGSIYVSQVVRDQVRDKRALKFVDLGEQQVKNIARPVHVYRIVMSGPSSPTSQTLAGPALMLPDKPSIAVLPFANMSGDPEQDYFADGMVEDIITGLARIKWMFVIARNSSFVYKGRSVDVPKIGCDLGVRYVLEGSVRKAGNRVRITAQLIDATTGAHVWAERYDRSMDDVFALQDEITMNVLAAIEPTVRQVEIERAKRKRPDRLDAYDLYLRSLPYLFTSIATDAGKALPLLEQALTLEPDYASALAAAAWCHEQRFLRGGMDPHDRDRALSYAREALRHGGDDATALAIAGFVVSVLEHDYGAGVKAIERALALSGSSSFALVFGSVILTWNGEPVRAIEWAERALRLSPFDPLGYIANVGLAYANLSLGRLAQALAAAAQAIAANPRFAVPYLLQIAALCGLGRMDEARAAALRVMEVQPNFTISSYVATRVGDSATRTLIVEGLRTAGLPE